MPVAFIQLTSIKRATLKRLGALDLIVFLILAMTAMTAMHSLILDFVYAHRAG